MPNTYRRWGHFINFTEARINNEAGGFKRKVFNRGCYYSGNGAAHWHLQRIGAVESPFVRDHFTKVPIIPGSSLKGKLRTLLAKMRSPGYVLNKIEDDDEVICRLFGSTSKNGVIGARLQFYDVFVTPESIEKISRMDTDTYMGEVKFENSRQYRARLKGCRQVPILRLNLCTTSKTKRKSKKILQPYRQRL